MQSHLQRRFMLLMILPAVMTTAPAVAVPIRISDKGVAPYRADVSFDDTPPDRLKQICF
jgi:hypothetical protein